jgi:hypothetical protein
MNLVHSRSLASSFYSTVTRCRISLRNDASGVTQNTITGSEPGRRGLPPQRQPCTQKIVGRRLMVPHGDRRYGSQSGRAINQHQRRPPRHDQIMSEFILNNYLADYFSPHTG